MEGGGVLRCQSVGRLQGLWLSGVPIRRGTRSRRRPAALFIGKVVCEHHGLHVCADAHTLNYAHSHKSDDTES